MEEYGFYGVKLNGAQNSFYIDDESISLPLAEEVAKTGKLLAFHIGADEYDFTHPYRGGFDLAVRVNGKSMQDVAMFVAKRLSTMDSVLSTSTHFILTRYKDGGIILDSGNEKDERRSVLCD